MTTRSGVVGGSTGLRLFPNVLGISFGVCGLAQCWSVANHYGHVPAWPADALWVIGGLVWGMTLAAYVVNVVRTGRVTSDLTDATYAPFIALAFIVPMLLGVRLAAETRTLGSAAFFVALGLTILFGGWISGQWIVGEAELAQWHPGYLLPTVAGGLVAATGSAELGHDALARLLFGYGSICWLVIGSIVLVRLFTQPMLAPPLVPTMAIEFAPPVVAGAAWFAINGDRVDAVSLGLAGYAVLMGLVQVRLIPVYARVPFAPSWWAFSFSYSAGVAAAIRWLAVTRSSGGELWTIVLLGAATGGMAVLVATTARSLWRGTFLPGLPAGGRQHARPDAQRV